MNFKTIFLKYFPDLLLKDLIKSVYYHYTFLKYFPLSTLKDKLFSLYYNIFVSYYNIVFHGFNLKFIDLPYSDSIPIKGYLNEYDIHEGDVVIDGGAYQGVFTLVASKLVGDEGKVIALEPDTETFQKLLSNIELNNITNVIPVKKGLWSKKSVLKFSNTHKDDASLFFDENDMGAKSNVNHISVVSIDDLLNYLNINKVNFIKLDVEGAEIEVIKGSKHTLLENDVKLAIGTYHFLEGEQTYIKVEELLKKMGYDVKTAFSEHLTTYAHKKN